MTDRQFVKSHFPFAILDYKVIPVNTMAPRIWYEVRTGHHGENSRRISTGDVRETAWRNAKKAIKAGFV